MNNKTALVFAGQTVGGSSAINGQYFDRGSKYDYDAWDQVSSPEFDSSTIKWNWDSLYPYFKKVRMLVHSTGVTRLTTVESVTFTEPSSEITQQYGYTWDTSVYGGTTPIYSSFPPFLWGDIYVAREAWKDMGIRVLNECAGGDKEGLCWIPISQHPVTAWRSHSGLGHYAAVNSTRKNYDLLVKHQVIRVVYANGTSSGPPLVEVRSLTDDRIFNVTAHAEVVLSAGAIHTPTILQRSGIGPASFLKAADIPMVIDLPGVGSNLQDHSSPGISWNCESFSWLWGKHMDQY
jgi:choline dehydrogenase